MNILVIDNYDSFTYNLIQCLGSLGLDPRVVRNDKISVDEVRQQKPDAIVISPGPGTPTRSGITLQLVRELIGEVPIFGVCLGHQAICEALGGQTTHAPQLVHGKTSDIVHDATGLFAGIPSPFTAARYHSLITSEAHLPMELRVTARTKDNLIMGVKHHEHDVFGVQFHPESFLTEHGLSLLQNFIEIVRNRSEVEEDQMTIWERTS